MAATAAIMAATVAMVAIMVATAATATPANPAAIAATATAAEITGDEDDEYQRRVHFSKKYKNNFNEKKNSLFVNDRVAFLLPHRKWRAALRIQYKCLVPIYVFPEMKLRSLLISKTEL